MKALVGMQRFFRIYAALIRFSVSRTFEFRLDFFFRFFMDCVYYAASIGFFELLFLHTEMLGGWTLPQVRIFIAGSLLLDGFYMTLVARNIWEFPSIINKGELDFYLTRPYPGLLLLLIRNFECSSLMNVVVGMMLVGYGLATYPETIAISQLVGFFFLLVNGFILSVCIRFFTVLPVFWTHSQFGFNMLLQSLDQVMDRPETIFRGAAHIFFLVIIPLFVR